MSTAYDEAMLNSGSRRRRGRVIETAGEELVVEFYDTGDQELLKHAEVTVTHRDPRAGLLSEVLREREVIQPAGGGWAIFMTSLEARMGYEP